MQQARSAGDHDIAGCAGGAQDPAPAKTPRAAAATRQRRHPRRPNSLSTFIVKPLSCRRETISFFVATVAGVKREFTPQPTKAPVLVEWRKNA